MSPLSPFGDRNNRTGKNSYRRPRATTIPAIHSRVRKHVGSGVILCVLLGELFLYYAFYFGSMYLTQPVENR